MKKIITITIALLLLTVFSIPAFAGGYNYQKHAYDNYQRSLTTPGMNSSYYKQVWDIRRQQSGSGW